MIFRELFLASKVLLSMRGRGQRVNSYTRACSNLADVLTRSLTTCISCIFCTCCNTCCSVSGCADGRVEECPVLPAAVREGGRPAPPLPGGSHRHGGGGSPLRGGAVLQGKQARLREGQLTRDQRMEIQGIRGGRNIFMMTNIFTSDKGQPAVYLRLWLLLRHPGDDRRGGRRLRQGSAGGRQRERQAWIRQAHAAAHREELQVEKMEGTLRI